MKFAIHSFDQNGNSHYHEYDNITQSILATNKLIPVFLDNDPRTQHLVVKSGYRREKKARFDNVRIQLGLKCNFSCKYCHQHLDQKMAEERFSDVDALVHQLVDSFIENKVECEKFTFWGGEPLVYWKILVKLIPLLHDAFPQSSMSLCTNGSLFTLDKAEFLAKYNVHIAISHDGPTFNVYRDDKNPLEDPNIVKAIQYYYDNVDHGVLFNVVITPDNCDLFEVRRYITEKVQREVDVNIESIVRCDRWTKPIIKQFDKHASKKLFDSLFAISTHRHDQFSRQFSQVSNVVRAIVRQDAADKRKYYCSSGNETFLAVDLFGNVLTCHDASVKTHNIGHISDLDNIDRESKLTSWLERDKCTKCPYVVACRGGCPKTVEGIDHDIACENLKLYYSIIFASAWYRIFNTMITSIRPIE